MIKTFIFFHDKDEYERSRNYIITKHLNTRYVYEEKFMIIHLDLLHKKTKTVLCLEKIPCSIMPV